MNKKNFEKNFKKKKRKNFLQFFPLLPCFFSQIRNSKGKKRRKKRSPFLSHFLLQKKKKEWKEGEKKQKKQKKRKKRRKRKSNIFFPSPLPKKKRGGKKREEKKKKWKKICAFKVISDAKKTSFHLSTKQGLFNFYYSKYLISRIKIFTSDGINQICENNDLYSHSLTIFVSGVYK